jgi:hypothetical protein
VHEHSITPTTCEFHVKLSRNLNIHESAPGLAIGAVAVSRLGATAQPATTMSGKIATLVNLNEGLPMA